MRKRLKKSKVACGVYDFNKERSDALSLSYRIVNNDVEEKKTSSFKTGQFVNAVGNRIWIDIPSVEIDGMHISFCGDSCRPNNVEIRISNNKHIVQTLRGVTERFERYDSNPSSDCFKYVAEISVDYINGKECDENINVADIIFSKEKNIPSSKLKPFNINNDLNSTTLNNLCNILNKLPMFEQLSKEDYSDIAGQINVKTCVKNKLVVGRDSTINSLFIIKSGTFGAYILKGKKKILLHTLSSGQVFGELSFLTGRPYSYEVIAHETSTLFEFKRGDIEKYFLKHPHVYKAVKKYSIKKAKEVALSVSGFKMSRRGTGRLKIDFKAFATFCAKDKNFPVFKCAIISISKEGGRLLMRKKELPPGKIRDFSIKLNIQVPLCLANIFISGDVMWHSTGDWACEEYYEIGVKFEHKLTTQQMGNVLIGKYRISSLTLDLPVIESAKKDKERCCTLISCEDALRHELIPFRMDEKVIHIAITDPFFMVSTSRTILLRFKDTYKIKIYIASKEDILKLQEIIYGLDDKDKSYDDDIDPGTYEFL